jgi:hypothetical protein
LIIFTSSLLYVNRNPAVFNFGDNPAKHVPRCFVNGPEIGAYFYVWFNRWLKQTVDPGEVLDQTLSGFSIQPFYIAFFTDIQWGIHIHLNEPVFTDDRFCQITHRLGGADKTADHDYTAVEKNLGQLCNSADVLHTVLHGITQIFAQTGTHDVAIENFSKVSPFAQLALDHFAERSLPGAGQTCQPDDLGALFHQEPTPASADEVVEIGEKAVMFFDMYHFKSGYFKKTTLSIDYGYLWQK